MKYNKTVKNFKNQLKKIHDSIKFYVEDNAMKLFIISNLNDKNGVITINNNEIIVENEINDSLFVLTFFPTIEECSSIKAEYSGYNKRHLYTIDFLSGKIIIKEKQEKYTGRQEIINKEKEYEFSQQHNSAILKFSNYNVNYKTKRNFNYRIESFSDDSSIRVCCSLRKDDNIYVNFYKRELHKPIKIISSFEPEKIDGKKLITCSMKEFDEYLEEWERNNRKDNKILILKK